MSDLITTTVADSGTSPATPVDKPKQINFFRPAIMALFAKITTWPPLDEVTVVPPSRKEFSFCVTVESNKSLPSRPWQVSIWYDYGSYSGVKGPWKALDLTPVQDGPHALLDDPENNSHRYYFTGSLPTPFPDHEKTYKGRRVSFTVRYRIDENSEWMWVYDNFNINDGELILQPPLDPNFLGASPVELKPGWFARKLASESPEARLYSIESASPIPISSDGNGKMEALVLGQVTQVARWFALVRIWEPWIAPRHGDSKLRLTEPAILISFLRSDGLHVVVFAINGIDDVLTHLESNEIGEIVVAARNDTGKERKFRALAASSWNFESAKCAVMYEARKLVQQSSIYKETTESFPQHIKTESVDSDTLLVSSTMGSQDDPKVTPQWLESWYDTLAFCTWNSLGQDLSLDKIMTALESLAKNNIHISSLIIDDNWQSLSGKQGETPQQHRGWERFEANPEGFPQGLKAAITHIREKHPKIRDIAVWHALMGYWGLISPDGDLAKTYKTAEVDVLDLGPKLAIHPDDIHRMYNDFYQFLSNCGITGVKTDAQFMLDRLTATPDRRNFITTYQSAWTQAYLRHLSGKAISCMSMMPQIMCHSFLPTNTPRILFRNSDDFFPDIPKSHPWHVFVNAHNALFVQHLNVLPDWDMFQTSHPYSGFHAASRCLSGGPIYITDTPGEHNVDLIHEMTALNTRGETVILRPSNVGKTIAVYEKYDAKAVLKIGVYDGRSSIGSSMVGVFNIAEEPTSFVLPITKFPGIEIGEAGSSTPIQRWIVRSHMSKRVTTPMSPVLPRTPAGLIQATLPVRGYDIWTARPVQTLKLASGNINLAVLGLLGKFTGACGLLNVHNSVNENGHRIRTNIQLKALGILGIWLSDAGKRKVDDLMIMIRGQPISADKVKIVTEGVEGDGSAGVIEIDVLGAWNELKLDPGWSNEASVEIII